jgi:hypothetical protein
MAEGSIELSIVMPCLNEAKTVGACVAKARQWLAERRVSGEVLVVDNASEDASAAIAAEAGARIVSARIRGYGNALMAGITEARGQFVIMGDADDSYDFTRLDAFLARLREGVDLVMGNRYRGGIRPGAMPFLNRYVGNPLLTGIGRLFFGSPAGDFYCGLRGCSRAAALRMNLRSSGMEFAIEMVVKATLLGMRIAEVPTTLSPDGRGRPSHLHPWRDGWRTLRFLLIYSPKWLFWYPGLFLVVAGSCVGVWVLPGPRLVGGVVYDLHTLAFAAMAVLLGVQAASFAAFTRVFAVSEGLLPDDPRLARLLHVVTLEAGLLIGAVFIAAGVAGYLSYAVARWSGRPFGPEEASRAMRVVIPSLTFFVLGCQVVLSSFFISILWLRRRRDGAPGDRGA